MEHLLNVSHCTRKDITGDKKEIQFLMSWSLQTSKRNQLFFKKSLIREEVEEGVEGKMVMEKIKSKKNH